MSKSALTRAPPRGVLDLPSPEIFLDSGPLRWVLVQSMSVELRILLSWSDELTIYTLLPLHRALHVARMWPNSKYKDINQIL